MVSEKDLIDRIVQHLPSANVKAYDMTGGGDHWQVRIEAQEFSGKTLIEQHQMIYKALGEWMDKDIHALSLDTRAVD